MAMGQVPWRFIMSQKMILRDRIKIQREFIVELKNEIKVLKGRRATDGGIIDYLKGVLETNHGVEVVIYRGD